MFSDNKVLRRARQLKLPILIDVGVSDQAAHGNVHESGRKLDLTAVKRPRRDLALDQRRLGSPALQHLNPRAVHDIIVLGDLA